MFQYLEENGCSWNDVIEQNVDVTNSSYGAGFSAVMQYIEENGYDCNDDGIEQNVEDDGIEQNVEDDGIEQIVKENGNGRPEENVGNDVKQNG